MITGISFAYWIAHLWIYRDRTGKGQFWSKLENGFFTFLLVVGNGHVFRRLGWCLGHPNVPLLRVCPVAENVPTPVGGSQPRGTLPGQRCLIGESGCN